MVSDTQHANIERFSGFASLYDIMRPQPPMMIQEMLTQWLETPRPRLVVDVGSGTGLATRQWANHADEVIGVEPNADMRSIANERVATDTVRFVDGVSTAIPLPDHCADIVTISQALHWMEPQGTFAEVARVLRPGGVLAVIDCDWPPFVHPDAEIAYEATLKTVFALEQSRGIRKRLDYYAKEEHLGRMAASGHFRYTREMLLHHQEMGDANRFVGVVLSQGSVATLLKQGVSEDEMGITTLREEATRILGETPRPWWWAYRVRLGVV